MSKLTAALIAISFCGASPAFAADNYLFGFSPYGTQTLIVNGSTMIQASDTGWISNDGQHLSTNQNYFVGDCETVCIATGLTNNYFVFDLSGVTATITSAVLSVGNGTGYEAGPLSTFSLFDVVNPISSLDQTRLSGDVTGQALFADLQSGVLFGSRSITSVVQNSQVDTVLNSSAIDALNAARGSAFAIGGTLRAGTEIPGSVPEPASWTMMLLGFGAIGAAMRRTQKTSHVRTA